MVWFSAACPERLALLSALCFCFRILGARKLVAGCAGWNCACLVRVAGGNASVARVASTHGQRATRAFSTPAARASGFSGLELRCPHPARDLGVACRIRRDSWGVLQVPLN